MLAVEKDLSSAALVAGFTRISLIHNVITSFIISRSGLGSSLIFTMMSSKSNRHPSAALVKFPSGRLTLKWEFKQIATAGPDTAAGSKFPQK